MQWTTGSAGAVNAVVVSRPGLATGIGMGLLAAYDCDQVLGRRPRLRAHRVEHPTAWPHSITPGRSPSVVRTSERLDQSRGVEG